MNRTKALSRGVGSKRVKAWVDTMNEWLEQQAKKKLYTHTHTHSEKGSSDDGVAVFLICFILF